MPATPPASTRLRVNVQHCIMPFSFANRVLRIIWECLGERNYHLLGAQLHVVSLLGSTIQIKNPREAEKSYGDGGVHPSSGTNVAAVVSSCDRFFGECHVI